MDQPKLKLQVKLLLDTPGLTITGWKKKYRNLPDREEGEDNASKITRVLLAGEDVELIDSYAGGACWDEPLNVDYDGSVSYLLDTNTIDRIIEYYKGIVIRTSTENKPER